MKLVYLPLCFLFPTKIPNSVDGSWEIKSKISPPHPSTPPTPNRILCFSEGMFRNSVPSAVLIQSYKSLWFWQVCFITVSVNWTYNSEGVYCYLSWEKAILELHQCSCVFWNQLMVYSSVTWDLSYCRISCEIFSRYILIFFFYALYGWCMHFKI